MKTVRTLAQYIRYIEILLSKKLPVYELRIVVPVDDNARESFALPVADKKHAKDIVSNASSFIRNASEVFFVNNVTKQIVNL